MKRNLSSSSFSSPALVKKSLSYLSKGALVSLSKDELVNETKRLVREELRIGLLVLEHLKEIERRKLYLERKSSILPVLIHPLPVP